MNTNSVAFFKNRNDYYLPEGCRLILAVWGIGNPQNIGQIIRLGHNVGAQKVIFVTDENKFSRTKIKKTAGFSYTQMAWEFVSESDFFSLLREGLKLVVLETCEGSTNIFSEALPDKVLILAGSESHGLPPGVIQKSSVRVHIPMPGGCKSMNVAQALTVASFEWFRQKLKE
ncbi:MAG: hypothetical protein J7L95_05210 [Prolixibacteraceae bacterium]|nr:hypothetical protein [Prolixibacteraceae bacterium]